MKNENLDIFFKEFAIIAELTSEDSPLLEIEGILDREYVPMFDNAGQASEGKQITFAVETAKTEGIRHGDELEIEERTYEIVGIQPFDDGKLTDLILKEID